MSFYAKKAIGLDPNGYKVWIELRLTESDGKLRFSMTGFAQWRPHTDYSYCGQIQDYIRKELGAYRRLDVPKAQIVELLDLWDRWHLNDLRSKPPHGSTSAWGYEPVPEDVIARAKELMKEPAPK